jgi:gliding motility-associated-like protein
VPKIILHKKYLLFVFFLSFTWAVNAQNITIKKNGAGICPGGIVTLSCDEPNLLVYTWQEFTAGLWGNVPGSSSSKTFDTGLPGRFRLTATDNLGNYKESDYFDIVLLTPPSAPIITPNRAVNQICQGDSLILKTTFQSNVQYFWYFDNDPNALNLLQTVTWVAKKAGTYSLKITDQTLNNGCSSYSLPFKLDYTSTVTVKIDSVPPFCRLSVAPINLTVTPTGGRFKGKGITDANNGTFSPSVAGIGKHEISYEVAQNGSCPSISDKRIISVSDLKPIITTNTGKTQFCVGDIATLSVLPDMKKYEWYKDVGASPVGALSKLDIGAGGNFNVKVIEKETLCSATSTDVNIEFFAASSVSIDPIASICGTDAPIVPLKGTPSGGAFTINGVFATTFDYKKLGFGSHKVSYVLNGSLPCLQGSAEQEVLIQDFPKPNLGPDILLGKGNSIKLKGEVDGGFTYSWLPITDLDNPYLPNPIANPDKTIEYTLTVKSSLGCKGEGKVNIVVYQPVYIPTAFTPNADGNNDLWELSGLEVYPNPEVQIFNRWGNMVFYSKGNYVSFDGTDKNKALPEGMYIYKINPFPDRPEFQYKGTFMLFR